MPNYEIPWSLISEDEPWDVVLRKRRKRKHKPTLASIHKQATKAGIEVERYEHDGDKIIVVIGKPTTSGEINGRSDNIDPNEWN